MLLQDPEFRGWHEQFRTKIALAIELMVEAYDEGGLLEMTLQLSTYYQGAE